MILTIILTTALTILHPSEAFAPAATTRIQHPQQQPSSTLFTAVNGEAAAAAPSKLTIETVAARSAGASIRLSIKERARTVTTSCTSGTLCTVSSSEGIEGSPFGSYVDYVLDDDGNPVLLMNEMSMHTSNILNAMDSDRSFCSLFMQLQGASGSGQDVSRCSLTGRITKIDSDDDDLSMLKMKYSIAHSYADRVMDSPKFSFYRLVPEKVYFVGGFGVLAEWVPVDDYKNAEPDILAAAGGEAYNMLKKLNKDEHKDDLLLTATHLLGCENVEDIRVTSIDRLGFDMRVTTRETRKKVKTNEYRLGFRIPVVSVEDAKSEVLKIFQEAWEKGQGYSWDSDDAPPGSTIPIMKIAEDSLD